MNFLFLFLYFGTEFQAIKSRISQFSSQCFKLFSFFHFFRLSVFSFASILYGHYQPNSRLPFVYCWRKSLICPYSKFKNIKRIIALNAHTSIPHTHKHNERFDHTHTHEIIPFMLFIIDWSSAPKLRNIYKLMWNNWVVFREIFRMEWILYEFLRVYFSIRGNIVHWISLSYLSLLRAVAKKIYVLPSFQLFEFFFQIISPNGYIRFLFCCCLSCCNDTEYLRTVEDLLRSFINAKSNGMGWSREIYVILDTLVRNDIPNKKFNF